MLVTPDGCPLAIRRGRPGRATYWVLPGGHVDPGDQTLEATLGREISEEIAGEADITSLMQVLESASAPMACPLRGHVPKAVRDGRRSLPCGCELPADEPC